MVVKARIVKEAPVIPASLDLGYLALFIGLRINEVVAEHMAAEGFGNVRESHGYLIQHLIEKERSITELADRMEVSQQAASKAVAELLRLGVIEVTGAADRRAKRIRLSSRGWRSVKLARQQRRKIETRLVKAVGALPYEEGKRILLRCLDELGGMERISSRRIRQPN